MTRRSLCDLFLPLADLRCYRGNRSKSVALVDSRYHFFLFSCFHPHYRCDFLREGCPNRFCLRTVFFLVSGVMPVFLFPLPIGENPIVFVPCCSAFGIGVDFVVFLPTSSMLCSGVSISTSVLGALFCLVSFFQLFALFCFWC